jgi:hypothetical protein
VEKRLRFLEQVAALPLQDPNDPDSQLGPGPPLKLNFTVLRVSLDDPKEKLFAAMVGGPQQQELIANGTSFAAPVFGKGRVLGAWALSEFDDMAIEDATLFLIGRCSCRIKNENPGWDVVLKTDWEQALAKAGEMREGEAASAASFSDDTKAGRTAAGPSALKPKTFVASAPVPSAVVPCDTTRRGRLYKSAVTAGVLAIVVAIAGFMLWFRR